MDQWKEYTCNAGDSEDTGLILRYGKIPWRKEWQSTPIFLPGKSHGQWSLTVYSPKGRKYIAIQNYIAILTTFLIQLIDYLHDCI